MWSKQDPHRISRRDVSIKDTMLSSTVVSIDHCGASALRVDHGDDFFSSLIGDKTHSMMVLLRGLSCLSSPSLSFLVSPLAFQSLGKGEK